jgi:fructose-1,6-bisphosphatase I
MPYFGETFLMAARNKSNYPVDSPLIVTVQQHIVQQQRQHFPEAGGTFSWLLLGITRATKMIQAKVRRIGLLDILGSAGATNVQGETQQKLDVYANQALLHCLAVRDSVAVLVSGENEEPVTFDRERESGKYIVVFDPILVSPQYGKDGAPR